MRKSYEDRIAKLKTELERQRAMSKQLLETNNTLQKKIYQEPNVGGEGIVSELVSDKAQQLILIDELKSQVDSLKLQIVTAD